MPLTPLRLSTITVWPSDSLSFSARSREIMSMVGPRGTGTMMVIGLAVGQVCAQADPYAARKPLTFAAGSLLGAGRSQLRHATAPCGSAKPPVTALPGLPLMVTSPSLRSQAMTVSHAPWRRIPTAASGLSKPVATHWVESIATVISPNMQSPRRIHRCEASA
jgi:hypothetical protein